MKGFDHELLLSKNRPKNLPLFVPLFFIHEKKEGSTQRPPDVKSYKFLIRFFGEAWES